MLRGILVTVKEFLKADVTLILNRICHPYLPLLIGMCTKQLRHIWVHLCAQLLEAMKYLHEEANILHNDIKSNNVLVAQSNGDQFHYQVVLIDFGKATSIEESKRYHLTGIEKIEIFLIIIAPEVVEGETKQSEFSHLENFCFVFPTKESLILYISEKKNICKFCRAVCAP